MFALDKFPVEFIHEFHDNTIGACGKQEVHEKALLTHNEKLITKPVWQLIYGD
jgi:hypothetical protein